MHTVSYYYAAVGKFRMSANLSMLSGAANLGRAVDIAGTAVDKGR